MGREKPRSPEYRILATGDRNWASPDVTDKVMDDYVARYPSHRMKVIEGGAKGADAAAGDWARRNKVKHVQVKADWAKHRRAAGPIRNKRMLDEHDPDAVVGFHDDISRSKGTANMLNLAMKDWPKRQRTIELYNSKGEVRQMARNEPSKRRVKKSLADIAKYHNEHDYLFDTHSEKTGERLDLGHRGTARWARKNYGTKQWWPKSEYEHFRQQGMGHPVDQGGRGGKWKQSKDYPSRKHPEHGYRYTTDEDHDAWDKRDQERWAAEKKAKIAENRKAGAAKAAATRRAKVKKSLADLGEISKALKSVDESPEFSAKWDEAERLQRAKGRKRIATSTALGAGLGGIGGAAINQKGMRGKGAAWSAGGSAVLSGSMAALNNRQRRKARENLRERIRLAPSQGG